jgi:glycogen operon protein
MILINSWWEPLDFKVPDALRDLGWRVELDTADPTVSGRGIDPSAAITLTGRSLMLLHTTQR